MERHTHTHTHTREGGREREGEEERQKETNIFVRKLLMTSKRTTEKLPVTRIYMEP